MSNIALVVEFDVKPEHRQAFEALILRMNAHPLAEARDCAAEMLRELRKVIPAFLTRVDVPDRGGAWSEYLATNRTATAALADTLLRDVTAEDRDEVVLTDFDPDGESKIVAAALYAVSDLPQNRVGKLNRDEAVSLAGELSGTDAPAEPPR